MTGLEFKPLFECDPKWIESIKLCADAHNWIVMDMMSDDYFELMDHLSYYQLVVPENTDKLGVIVYGYTC